VLAQRIDRAPLVLAGAVNLPITARCSGVSPCLYSFAYESEDQIRQVAEKIRRSL
jgi:hypothetical protein